MYEERRGEGPGFRTKLTHRWLFDARILEAANEVLDESGCREHNALAASDEEHAELTLAVGVGVGTVRRSA